MKKCKHSFKAILRKRFKLAPRFIYIYILADVDQQLQKGYMNFTLVQISYRYRLQESESV